MTLWRLEIARLLRTKRIIALAGVYLFFGLVDPVIIAYMDKILSWFQSSLEGASIVLPPATVETALAQYSGDAAQLGTLVVVVVAAGSVALDKPPEMGVFLRTRVPQVGRLLLPRIVVVTIAAVAASLLGTIAAGYETAVLLGPLPWAALVESLAVSVVSLGFVVLLVSVFAQTFKGTLATVLASLGFLLLVPILGVVPEIGRWLPTRLINALGELSSGTSVTDMWPALLVTVLLGGLCWWLAVGRAARTEH